VLQWGCWDQRVFVRLEVELVEKPIVTPKPATCDLLDATKGTKSITIKNVKYTANDATINTVTVSFGDGTTKVLKTSELPFTHNYAAEGNYSIKATLNTSMGDVTSTACTIPDTGAGSVFAIFALVTAAAAFVHNLLARRNVRG
jgi:PKD domain